MKTIKLPKKNKWLITIALSAIVIAGAIGWGVNSYAKEKEEQQQITEQEKQIADVAKKVDSLYLDDTKEFLAKDISKDKIEEADKALQALKDEKILTKEIAQKVKGLASDWGHADVMYNYQLEVAKLLDPNKVLREDANIQQVEEQRKELVESTKKENFAKSFDPILKEAIAQRKQITEATKQVDSLYTSNEHKEVKDGITWDTYNKAKASVDKVKQEKANKDLTTGLKKANDALKAEDAIKEVASNSNDTSTNPSSNNNATSNSSGKSSGNSSNSTSGNSGNSSSRSTSGSSKSSSSSSSKSASGSSKSNKSSSNSGSSSKASDGSTSKNEKGGPDYHVSDDELTNIGENENGGTDYAWGW
ncbi:toxin Cry1Ac domain D-VI-related protein [Listeria marthii]|uniref:toxin Cry1Ac domain D-VI-related protein n=1 Tax=Listeria marthii TaxID=529731 RepID=UPI0028801B70|nr:toxin Cry1Ac domain D-VI-related protein [Listeria marthii]MDT0090749.1 toxin Cry1Ac domain D-VI-related protein [Listeria marthii]